MNPQHQRSDEPPLDERLAAYHEAILAGEVVEEDESDAQLARAQRCLKAIESLRRKTTHRDSAWIFASDDRAARQRSAEQHQEFDMLLHCARNPPQKIGRFRIERLLGEGGFGIVFLATDPELNRHVALKVPRPETLFSPAGRRRFLREAEAVALLSHPRIVPVYEVGHAGSLCYIVQAYCPGTSLDQWLTQSGSQLSPQAAAKLVLVLSKAVQHAHSRGVLHRDIKPSNVLLEAPDRQATGLAAVSEPAAGRRPLDPELDEDVRRAAKEAIGAADGHTPAERPRIQFEPAISESQLAELARLSDFGLARLADQPLERTRHGDVLGTPAYMAPEQAEGDSASIGTSADIYALGAVLYELLTGNPPHEKKSLLATLESVRRDDPVAPHQLNRTVPADLEAICLKCLEKQPQRRYATAKDLAEDLTRYLQGKVVSARHATAVEHLQRWCRRNPRVATLSAMVVLLVLLVIGGSTGAAVLLSAAQRKALDNLEEAIVARNSATRNEDLAVRALFEARVAQATALQRSGAAGQRLDSLDALSKATGHAQRLKLGAEHLLMLRNKAIASMALLDLEAEQKWQTGNRRPLAISTDSDVEQYAYASDLRTVAVQRLGDRDPRLRLPISEACEAVSDIHWDRRGQYVAARCRSSAGCCKLFVWSTASGKLLVKIDAMAGRSRPVDFSPDGNWMAVARPDGDVAVLSLPDMTPSGSLGADLAAWTLRFAPDSGQLAVYRTGRIEIVDVASSEVTCRIDCPSFVYQLDWSPDAGTLVLACEDDVARVWPVGAKQFGASLSGHGGDVTRVAFHPDGKLLATYGLDRSTRIWDVSRAAQVLRVDRELMRFSRDGKWLGTATARSRLVLPTEQRLSIVELPGSKGASPDRLSVDTSGRLLAVNSRDQLSLIDLLKGQTLVQERLGGGWVQFEPTGRGLVAVTHATGLCRLPMRREDGDEQIKFSFAAREPIAPASLGFLDISRDGRRVALVDRYYRPKIVVHDMQRSASIQLQPHHTGARWLDLTSGGTLLAVGTDDGRDITVWDTQTGERIKTLEAGPARIRFSPDGRQLVVDEGHRCTVWDTQTWQPLRPARRENLLAQPAPIAYSEDGRLLAVLAAPRRVQLLDGKTLSQLASWQLSTRGVIQSLAFSPDASQLVAGVGQPAAVHVWQLAATRRHLRDIQLDWDPPLPARVETATATSVAIQMDLSELFPLRQQDVDRFERQFEATSKHIAADPQNAHAYWRRGRSAVYLDRYEQAIADCTRAIQLKPEMHHGYFWRGRAYQKQYQCVQAIADLEKSLALRPRDAWCCRHLADLYALGPESVRNADRAVQLARRSIERFHKTTSEHVDTFLTTLAAAHYRSGDLEQTTETLDRAEQARRYPPDATILFLRAMCFQKLEQPDQARRCYDEAIKWQDAHGSTPYTNVLQREASQLLGVDFRP